MSQILRRYLTKERRVRNFFYCLIQLKEPCVRKFEGPARSKFLGFCKLKESTRQLFCAWGLSLQLMLRTMMRPDSKIFELDLSQISVERDEILEKYLITD